MGSLQDPTIVMIVTYIKSLINLDKQDYLIGYKEFLPDESIDEKMFKLLDIETLIDGVVLKLAEYYFNNPVCIDSIIIDVIYKKIMCVAFHMTNDYRVLIEEMQK